MPGFIAKRIVALFVILFIVATILFIVFRTLPADPASTIMSPRMSPDLKEVLRDTYGLDKSLEEQYVIYLRNLLHRNFGASFYFEGGVYNVLENRLLSTALLTGVALIMAVVIDFFAESLYAKKAAIVNTLFYLVPFLFLGLLFIYVFSYKLDLFPIGGMKSPELWGDAVTASLAAQFLDVAYHLFLPCIMMVIWIMVGFLPLVKTMSRGIIEERKSLVPPGITTLVSASVLFYGVMITESLFSWPGFHSVFVEGTLNYDFPLIQGALIAGVFFCLVVAAIMEVFYAAVASRKVKTSHL
jgi:peptide/nickel transport system permease protein